MNLEHFALNATPFNCLTLSTQAGSTFESTPIDISAIRGGLLAVLQSKNLSGTNPTLDVKAQSSATSGGTYADVTGFTFAQQTTNTTGSTAVKGISADAAKPWLKFVGTIGGTSSPSYEVGIAVAGVKQYR